jgi:hypothetical protein
MEPEASIEEKEKGTDAGTTDNNLPRYGHNRHAA